MKGRNSYRKGHFLIVLVCRLDSHSCLACLASTATAPISRLLDFHSLFLLLFLLPAPSHLQKPLVIAVLLGRICQYRFGSIGQLRILNCSSVICTTVAIPEIRRG